MGLTKDFATIVSEDIKNKCSQHDKEWLRLPENHEKWRTCLFDIIETVNLKIVDLEHQISNLRDTYGDFTIDPAVGLEEQREKSNRFRFYAEKRLVEVDRLISLGNEVDPSVSLASFLRDAIKAHKQWHVDNNLVPSEGDDCLYAALDGMWRF